MEIKYRTQLVELMRELKLPLVGVELGVAEGLFSRDLLKLGLDKLYSIDFWGQLQQPGDGFNDDEWHIKNYNNAMKLFKPFGDKSVVIKGLSYEVAKDFDDESLGLVYVDCDHSYESVRKDIMSWYPKLVDGGIMAFHDYEMDAQYGVKKAVNEFADKNNLEVNLIPENQKCDAGAWFQKK